MRFAGPYLYDIRILAEKLVKEFGTLPYEKFVGDRKKLESAIMRLRIMKEGLASLPNRIQRELAPIDWRAVTGRWNQEAHCHVGFDPKKLWETIVQKLPEIGSKAEELLKSQS